MLENQRLKASNFRKQLGDPPGTRQESSSLSPWLTQCHAFHSLFTSFITCPASQITR